jgi:hypothetical protein
VLVQVAEEQVLEQVQVLVLVLVRVEVQIELHFVRLVRPPRLLPLRLKCYS